MNNKDWIERKYFMIGYRNIRAKTILNILKGFNGKFFTQQVSREMFMWDPRGEQLVRILKEFSRRGFLKQENTLKGIDSKGAKMAKYIYELKEEIKINQEDA